VRVPALRSDENLAIDLPSQGGVVCPSRTLYDFPNDGYLVLSLITSRASFAEGSIECCE